MFIQGGAILVVAGLLTAEHCTIEQHTSVGQGSVLYASGGFVVFGIGMVFRDNTAVQAGALLRIDSPASVRIESSIISGSCLENPDVMWTEIGTPPRMLKTLGQVMLIVSMSHNAVVLRPTGHGHQKRQIDRPFLCACGEHNLCCRLARSI